MATGVQIQTLEAALPCAFEKSDSHWLERTASSRKEARILFEMMQRSGGTVESFRELIAIPPHIEEALRLYAYAHPEDPSISSEYFGFETCLQKSSRIF